MIYLKAVVLFFAISLSLGYINSIIEAVVLRKSSLSYFSYIIAFLWVTYIFLVTNY